MVVLTNPFIENLRLITDTVTKRSVSCTAKEISAPFQWRVASSDAHGADGGYDTTGGRAFLKTRTISCTLIKVFDTRAGESFATATAALEKVLNPGNKLELTFVDDTGRTWLWNVRCSDFDKKHALTWVGYCEFPVTFVATDPRQRSEYKPGVPLLDDQRLLDDAWFLDTDPDSLALTGTTFSHVINNDGTAADEAPIVSVQGPLTPPIYGIYYFQDGTNIFWAYVNAIAAGEVVTFDAVQREVRSSNTTVDAYHAFTPPANSSSWGRIDIGATTFQMAYAAAGAGASVAVDWRPRK